MFGNLLGFFCLFVFFPPTFSGSGQPTAVRTQLLKRDGAKERADFTPGSPSSPAVTAALGFGHRVPVARLDLAHAMEDFGEAVAFSDVCEAKGGWLGNAGRKTPSQRRAAGQGFGSRRIKGRAYLAVIRNWSRRNKEVRQQ